MLTGKTGDARSEQLPPQLLHGELPKSPISSLAPRLVLDSSGSLERPPSSLFLGFD